jgi:dTDP-4-dehydrorhamnose 3,5-epimerase-like enzyme
MIELHGDELSGIRVPVGVMHGFYCHEPSMYIYGVDSYFDLEDELGCHWADPQLGQRFLSSNHIRRPYRACRTRCGPRDFG